MKQTLTALITTFTLATALCACGQGKPSASSSSPTESSSATSPAPEQEQKVQPLISLADKPLAMRFQAGMGVPIYEVMEAAYGMYHQNMYCHAYKVGGTEYCMEKQYIHVYQGDSKPHLFMTKSNGQIRKNDIDRYASGGLGFFLFTIEGDTIHLIQKQPFTPVWSNTETPSFKYPQFGRETAFGPNVGTGIEVTLKPQFPDNRNMHERKVLFGVRNSRIVKYAAFRSVYINAALGTELKADLKVAPQLAPQNAVYPLQVTVIGRKNGEPVTLEPFIFRFDESRNQYIIPPAYIQLMGK